MDAYANSDVSFEKVLDILHPERDLSRSPLFQVMFAFNNAISDSINFPNVKAEPMEVQSSYAHLEMTCFLEEKNEMVEGCIEYNIDLFSQETIQRFIRNYLSTLAELVNYSEKEISQAVALSAAEKKDTIDRLE